MNLNEKINIKSTTQNDIFFFRDDNYDNYDICDSCRVSVTRAIDIFEW